MWIKGECDNGGVGCGVYCGEVVEVVFEEFCVDSVGRDGVVEMVVVDYGIDGDGLGFF